VPEAEQEKNAARERALRQEIEIIEKESGATAESFGRYYA
jgi:hypothetical protein